MHANITASGDHDIYTMLADVAAQQRDLPALLNYAPRAEALAAQYGHDLYRAVALRAWGVADRLSGEWEAGRRRMEHALGLFHALDTRWQVGRTLYELGDLAAAQAQPALAREHFTGALAAFEAMRAVPAAERTQAALAALA